VARETTLVCGCVQDLVCVSGALDGVPNSSGKPVLAKRPVGHMFFGKRILTIALLALASPALAQGNPSDPAEPDQLIRLLAQRRALVVRAAEPRTGEICLVCNKPVGDGDVAYLVNGQRAPVHSSVCDGQLRANPAAVLAPLRPHGAFLGAETEQPALASRWFVFGLYVLIVLFFGALCAQLALHTGQKPVPWFLAGLAFNILGYAALRSRPRQAFLAPGGISVGRSKIPSTHAPVACAICGAAVHPTASNCPGCGAELRPRARSEVSLVLGTR